MDRLDRRLPPPNQKDLTILPPPLFLFQVYKGEYRGAPVAIKTFDRIKLAEADEETLIEIREEAQMMSRLCACLYSSNYKY